MAVLKVDNLAVVALRWSSFVRVVVLEGVVELDSTASALAVLVKEDLAVVADAADRFRHR